MKQKIELTHEYLKSVLHYDGFSGEFYWIPGTTQASIRNRSRRLIGGLVLAGGYRKDKTGSGSEYRTISFKKVRYYTHRLAWFYVTGAWPIHQIDHINGNRSDNRFENLREATHIQNNINKSKKRKSSSRFKGVAFHPSTNKWTSFCNGKYLGLFKTQEEAALSYNNAAKVVFGEFAKLNVIQNIK